MSTTDNRELTGRSGYATATPAVLPTPDQPLGRRLEVIVPNTFPFDTLLQNLRASSVLNPRPLTLFSRLGAGKGNEINGT